MFSNRQWPQGISGEATTTTKMQNQRAKLATKIIGELTGIRSPLFQEIPEIEGRTLDSSQHVE